MRTTTRKCLDAGLLALATCARPAAAGVTVTIRNADDAGNQLSRFDVDGNALDAHDGTLALFGDTYYLYGTSYACGYQYRVNSNFCGFKVYSSPDLVHFTDRGFVVPAANCTYCFRPHVFFNASTRTYVMWSDAGGSYRVHTSSSPTGPFTRQPDPVLAVGGAVDESLFVDDDGTAYLIHNTTQVATGLTADMVVEKLTPDYLRTTGESARLGLGDVEAFAVFKRNGIYHALMSDPSCAYCSGGTGEMTSLSMLGPWSGAWFDPDGVHQSGRAEPRMRARIVNGDSCGGQPLAVLPVAKQDGSTDYFFVSDRWNDRAPNESLANFFIGPLSFESNGDTSRFACVSSFTAELAVGAPGAYSRSAQEDQSSGFDGFRHYCDIRGSVQRQQSFTPSRTHTLLAASLTTFRSGEPDAPLVLDVLDDHGTVLDTTSLSPSSIPWAPHVVTVRPGIEVVAGHSYILRLHSSTTTGCYGFEYNDGDVYRGGAEAFSTNNGASFTTEPARDLKFSVDVARQEDGGVDAVGDASVDVVAPGPAADASEDRYHPSDDGAPAGRDARATEGGNERDAAWAPAPPSGDGGGCACSAPGRSARPHALPVLLALVGLLLRRDRGEGRTGRSSPARRRAAPPTTGLAIAELALSKERAPGAGGPW
jgi:MYXO-CTERM domain-containing protein